YVSKRFPPWSVQGRLRRLAYARSSSVKGVISGWCFPTRVYGKLSGGSRRPERHPYVARCMKLCPIQEKAAAHGDGQFSLRPISVYTARSADCSPETFQP